MRVHIEEAFINIPRLGPHVMEGHYSLRDSKKEEHILPGLWTNTIKPGASITMMMWPNLDIDHPLRSFSGPPPFGLSPRRRMDDAARQRRIARMQAVSVNAPPHLSGRIPPGIRPGMPRPMGPMNPLMGGPPPPMARPFPVFPGVEIVNGRNRRRAASSIRTLDEDEMTEAEEKELTFVNFLEELERTKHQTTSDVLGKYTRLHDVLGHECIDVWGIDESRYNSDSDSSGSSGSLVAD